MNQSNANVVPIEALAAAEAAALVNEIERMESGLKQNKEKLKKLIDNHFNGSLKLGEDVWGYSPSISWKSGTAAMKALFEVLAIDDVDAFEYVSFNEAAKQKILKDHGIALTDDMMKSYGFSKHVTHRFGCKKAD